MEFLVTLVIKLKKYNLEKLKKVKKNWPQKAKEAGIDEEMIIMCSDIMESIIKKKQLEENKNKKDVHNN